MRELRVRGLFAHNTPCRVSDETSFGVGDDVWWQVEGFPGVTRLMSRRRLTSLRLPDYTKARHDATRGTPLSGSIAMKFFYGRFFSSFPASPCRRKRKRVGNESRSKFSSSQRRYQGGSCRRNLLPICMRLFARVLCFPRISS